MINGLAKSGFIRAFVLPSFKCTARVRELYLRSSCTEDEMEHAWKNRKNTLASWEEFYKAKKPRLPPE